MKIKLTKNQEILIIIFMVSLFVQLTILDIFTDKIKRKKVLVPLVIITAYLYAICYYKLVID